MNCNVYDDLRAKMLDAVSSALSKEGVEVEEAMKSEEGRKMIMTALMGVFSSNSELSSSAAFLQAGNATQERDRSDNIGSKDMREIWTILTEGSGQTKEKRRVIGEVVSICVPVDDGTNRIE